MSQFALLIVLFCLIYHFFKKDEREAKSQSLICEKYIDSEFFGIVDKCFIDHAKKGRHFFKLRNREDTLRMWYYGSSGLGIGDSIVKEKGKAEYRIFKKNHPDSILVLKFDCNK